MSRANTTDKQAGDALSAAVENATLAALAAGTADVNDENVRDEGVDARNLGDYPAHVTMQLQDNASTSATTYDSGYLIGGSAYGADGTQDLSHDSGLELDLSASPVTVSDGDLVVIEWQVLKWEVVSGGTGNDNECWVVQGYWDITSDLLTDYATLEGDDPHGNTFQIPGRLFDETQDCSVIPHVVPIDGTDHESPKHATRGFWVYEHSGDAISIYGIKLMLSGTYGITHYDSGAGFADEVFYPNPVDAEIDIERGMLSLQVYRK